MGLYERSQAKPDMGRINPMQNKAFDPAGSLALREAKGLDRSAGVNRSFETEKARTVRSFFGIKNPWLGKKVFAVPAKRKETKEKFDVRAANVPGQDFAAKPFYDDSKEAPVRGDYATRKANFSGSAQGAVSQIGKTAKQNLTVEDVREILNKND